MEKVKSLLSQVLIPAFKRALILALVLGFSFLMIGVVVVPFNWALQQDLSPVLFLLLFAGVALLDFLLIDILVNVLILLINFLPKDWI